MIEEYEGYMPALETERLILRRINMHDAQDLYNYGRDPLVAKHVLWDAYKSIFEARSYVRYMLRRYRMGDAASWGIELKSTRQIIGTIGFMWVQTDNCSAEVGYSLGRSYWNNGIMTEALRETIRYGFYGLHLNRIEAQHETDNPASGAVMRKCGMTKEGTLRQRLLNKGHFVDVDVYSILRSEFNEIEQNKESGKK